MHGDEGRKSTAETGSQGNEKRTGGSLCTARGPKTDRVRKRAVYAGGSEIIEGAGINYKIKWTNEIRYAEDGSR